MTTEQRRRYELVALDLLDREPEIEPDLSSDTIDPQAFTGSSPGDVAYLNHDYQLPYPYPQWVTSMQGKDDCVQIDIPALQGPAGMLPMEVVYGSSIGSYESPGMGGLTPPQDFIAGYMTGFALSVAIDKVQSFSQQPPPYISDLYGPSVLSAARRREGLYYRLCAADKAPRAVTPEGRIATALADVRADAAMERLRARLSTRQWHELCEHGYTYTRSRPVHILHVRFEEDGVTMRCRADGEVMLFWTVAQKFAKLWAPPPTGTRITLHDHLRDTGSITAAIKAAVDDIMSRGGQPSLSPTHLHHFAHGP